MLFSKAHLKEKIYIFIVPAIILLVLCLITYGNILSHNFFMIDDYRLLIKTAQIHRHLSDYFLKSEDQHYAPLCFYLNALLFKLFQAPFYFHLINFVLFYIDCLFLFILVYFISKEFVVALLTSILFCIHPMTAEILQHITFNVILLQTALMEAALLMLYFYSKERKSVVYLLFSILIIFFALFLQETIVLFPFYVFSFLFFVTSFSFKKSLLTTIPFMLLSFLLLVLCLFMSSQNMNLLHCIEQFNLDFWDWSANFSRLVFWYLGNLFMPQSIVFMYNIIPSNSFVWQWNLLFFSFLIGCVLLIFIYFKKSLESFAIALFLIGFIYAIPGSLARPNIGLVFEPHWFYFSSIGVFLLFILLLLRLRRHVHKVFFIMLTFSFFICCFISTQQVNIIASNPLSYYENWLQKSPGNSIPIRNLALIYSYKENIDIPLVYLPYMINIIDFYIKNDFPEISFKLIKKISSSKISTSQHDLLQLKIAAYRCKYEFKGLCQ